MNPVEIGLSFLEGLALIASPCILPVLPLVLSASIDGGRRRPFGIILGFVVSFSAFALASRKLVSAFAVDLEIIKNGSLILLAFFGLVLLSEGLSRRFSALTQRFADKGAALTSNAGEGFGSGILIGLLIGLVWTPCAGPILAAVLVQVIRQESDAGGLLVIGAFALGAAVPMLLIALSGRRLVAQFGFLAQHAEKLRKAFGVIVLLAVAFIASGADPQAVFMRGETEAVSADALSEPLPNPYPAPEFTGIETWLNSPPLTMESLRGKVVLVDFWTYSCINCIRTFPYITAWDEKYREKGLVIVGVHAPEFAFEKDRAKVEAAARKHGIKYPVALDNNFDTWTAYQNQYWPAHYLIDRAGKVVYTHFGEGKYAQTEGNIRYLLGLTSAFDAMPEARATSDAQTDETYLGYGRAARYHSEPFVKDAAFSYRFPPDLPDHGWALEGDWRVEAERIVAVGAGAKLKLHFTARHLFLVLGASGGAVKATVLLNGKPVNSSALTVNEHRLYTLVDQGEIKPGVIEIIAETPGLEAYAFTFGSK